MRRIYLDYAATTPLDPRVRRAMEPYFGSSPARHARQRAGIAGWGNPGSLHSFGQEAIAAVDLSRETIANAIGADFREVVFTGSATEANNLALRGIVRRAHRIMNHELRGANRRKNAKTIIHNSKFIIPRIIVSAIEHESVLETARDLERDGVEVVVIPVDTRGVVDLKKLEAALNERTVLVSVMYANNEIGTVQPVSKIAELISDFREHRAYSKEHMVNTKNHKLYAIRHLPLLHTDAVQAFQFFDCNPDALGVDLMTLSAHKIYGPKGVGALYMRSPVQNAKIRVKNDNKKMKNAPRSGTNTFRFDISNLHLTPVITGGGQEFGMRAGTENVPLIVGFAKAAELAGALRERERRRARELGERFWMGMKRCAPRALLNGPPMEGRNALHARLPHVINVCLPGAKAADLLVKLDLAGIAVSTGSACAARSAQPSHVLRAIGCAKERMASSIRFSIGRMTRTNEIDFALAAVRKLYTRKSRKQTLHYYQ